MTFFKLCDKTAKISLKSLLILIIGLVTAFSLIMAWLSISAEIINYNYYGSKLKIAIPQRKADFREDTHGGFHGDGDTVEIYELTDKEIKTLSEDVKTNSRWKPIDDAAAVLYPSEHSGGYLQNNVPQIENGWYCFYDKQTKTFEFPAEDVFSYNYIICQYSEKEGKLWIYELDT